MLFFRIIGTVLILYSFTSLAQTGEATYEENLLGDENGPDNDSEFPSSDIDTDENEDSKSSESSWIPDVSFTKHKFSGGLSIGSSLFEIQVRVKSYFSEWVAIETQAAFRREQGDIDDTTYEVMTWNTHAAPVVMLPLVTWVVPYAGAGLGIANWTQDYDGETFDSGTALRLIAFTGAEVSLNSFFGVDLRLSSISYLTQSPKDLENREDDIDQPHTFFTVGFFFSI